MPDLARTRTRVEFEKARYELRDGAARMRSGPSRFGVAGKVTRQAIVRATRHLQVRQEQLDARIVAAMDSIAFDTSVAGRAASAFPGSLDPRRILDLETVAGRLYVHSDDRVMSPFISEHGFWEAAETAFVRRVLRPGATFVDVGANVGYFSVLAARIVGPEGRVIAVEPEEDNLGLLKANLWRNGCANAVVLPVAASSETGFLPLRVNEENRGDHQVGPFEDALTLVPCARLDDLLAGTPVDLVKIDTQGVDHDVVAGLAEVLGGSPRATLMCEFWLEGMRDRGVDPLAVAVGYERLGLRLELLDDDGMSHPAWPGEVVAAAEDAPGAYVNVVLRGATTPHGS